MPLEEALDMPSGSTCVGDFDCRHGAGKAVPVWTSQQASIQQNHQGSVFPLPNRAAQSLQKAVYSGLGT